MKHLPRSSLHLVHDETKSFGSIPSPHPVYDETKSFVSTPLSHPLDAIAKKFNMIIYIKSAILKLEHSRNMSEIAFLSRPIPNMLNFKRLALKQLRCKAMKQHILDQYLHLTKYILEL